MVKKILVALRPGIDDVQGTRVALQIREELGLPVGQVRMIKVYLLDGLSSLEVDKILELGILHDPVLHQVSLQPVDREFDWIIEVGFRPGVTDNEGRVAKEAIINGLGLDRDVPLAVYTARQYLLQGQLSAAEVQRIGRDLLANELIQAVRCKSWAEWEKEPGFASVLPEVTGRASDRVEVVPLSGLSDQELLSLSKERVLALSLQELKAIAAHYASPGVQARRRQAGLPAEPLDAELEILAQTWSEHCKHKIFNARINYLNKDKGQKRVIDSLFKTYIQSPTELLRSLAGSGDYCLSVFKDNAGVIRFDPEHNVCIKVETHNSPSALDPYGGALTGIVGVNRDPMGTGLGANLICNTDVFCFASPFYDQPLPPRLLHPRRVLEGVRKGVEDGGNQSGIPTVNGGLIFDERYLGKPLVFCGTVGLMPARVAGRPSHEKQAQPGDWIVMTGGRVGKDGIHGATFSSEALHAGSPVTAVQIGDPITQRKMYDFLMRARDLGLYNAITDNGAGGLSSSVGEMAEDTGGCDFDLALVPLKYDGLVPWEILLSEAQERMTLAVPSEKLEEFMQLAREMDVEATALGRFNASGYFRVRYGEKIVADLEMEFLHHGLPQMELQAIWDAPAEKEYIRLESGEDPAKLLQRMLGRLNICSREYVIRQYDHEVQGGSVIKPLVGEAMLGPGDAAVIRPLLDKEQGLVVANGICPRYSDLDTYWMAANAVDEAIRNAVAVGADPGYLAGVDNFCWCDPVFSDQTPDGHYKLAQLVRANQALAHYCLGFGVPCISGKDSMKNDYQMEGIKISIPPTLLFSLIGVIPDVTKCQTSDLKAPGDLIYLLGLTRPELGASEVAAELGGQGGLVPEVDLLSARKRYQTLYQALDQGLVTACHDLSDGGLAVALAEMAIGGGLGVQVDLDQVPCCPQEMSLLEIMYSESASRLLVSVAPHNRQAFENLFAGQKMACLGKVVNNQEFRLDYGGESCLLLTVDELRQAWRKTLDW